VTFDEILDQALALLQRRGSLPVRTCGKSAAFQRGAKFEPLSRALPRAFACSRILYPLRTSAFLAAGLLGALSEDASGLPCSASLTCNGFGLRL
jgi:hypothetical protein